MPAADLLHASIADVVAAHGHAARLLIERGMNCVGCPFARFETLADAAAAYGVDPGELVLALAAAAPQRVPGDPTP
jgi:hybrid cluster-associated redox disulfide protein